MLQPDPAKVVKLLDCTSGARRPAYGLHRETLAQNPILLLQMDQNGAW